MLDSPKNEKCISIQHMLGYSIGWGNDLLS
jgi:hypothetical protein